MKVLLLFAMVLVPALQSELKILDTPDGGIRPAPCAVTCSGVGRWDETEWYWKWMWDGSKVFKNINISGCKFVSPPTVVTATTRGGSDCLPVTVSYVSETQFDVYSVGDTTETVQKMEGGKCSVNWIATGYNC